MSKSSLDRLIYMANQIAANQSQTDDPAAATAKHISLYWDPRMKAMIGAYRGTELSPVAAMAVAHLSA